MPALAAPAGPRPAKLVSLGGPTALKPGSVHDYRYWGNGDDLIATGTSWAKLWVAWVELQGGRGRPGTREQSWHQLGAGLPGSPGMGLPVIDAQVRAANRDGVRVILCLQHDVPSWASRVRGDPLLAPSGRHTSTQRLPRETGVESPFGWFVAYLCARYRPAAPNLTGPREPEPGEVGAPGADPRFGNPMGAFVDAIEIANEPNLLAWPQAKAPAALADMIRTADVWSARFGGPLVLGPATSDTEGRAVETSGYVEFTRAVLRELSGWRPRGAVAWSHHNYGDISRRTTERLERVRDELERAGWHDRAIWLTEGGYDTTPHRAPQTVVTPAAKRLQASLIEEGYRRVADFSERARREGRVGVVPTFAQHPIHDQATPTNTFKSGLRDDFQFDPPRAGARRPAWFTWRDLG